MRRGVEVAARLRRTLLAPVVAAATLLPCPAGADAPRVHGQIVSTLRPEVRAVDFNASNRGDTPFDLLELDLFVDAAPGEDLQVRTWLAFNDSYSSVVSLAAAYFLYEAVDAGRLYLQAGKVPMPLGNYLDRYSANRGPLTGVPLSWFYHSTLARDRVPTSAADLLAARGTGQIGPPVYASGNSKLRGAALLYAACYDYGAVALGAAGSLEYKLGLFAGTPGVPASGEDSNGSRTLAGRLGWSPGPALRLGLSSAWGAYLPEEVADTLPDGRDVGDYAQTVVTGDLEVARGHWTAYAEVVWGR